MELTKVLLIEDNAKLRHNVMEEFEKQGVEVVQIPGYDQLDSLLNTSSSFQMVILDWLLDGETSSDALLCLAKIRRSRFVPVVVWTEEIEVFEAEREQAFQQFPEAGLKGFSKAKVSYTHLIEVLTGWYESPIGRLSEIIRQSIVISIEEALFKLAEHSSDDLARGLKTLIASDEANVIDIEHTIDLLMRLISRDVYRNKALIDEIQQTVEKLNLLRQPATRKEKNLERQKESRLKEFHMFYEPDPGDNIIRTGDILELTIGSGKAAEKMRGIVITPACDLANPGKTAFVRIALIHEKVGEARSGEDKWPYLFENGRYSEVCYHEIIVVKNQTLATDSDDPKKAKRSVMLYRHEYQTLGRVRAVLHREKRLDEPYRSDLLHHFVSHAGRIGLPDFTATFS